MRISGWAWLFLACGAVAVAEACLDRTLMPYAGTVAVLALLGLAVARYASVEIGRLPAAWRVGNGSEWTAAGLGLGGLAAVTLAAAVVEGERRDWPGELGGSGIGEIVLLAAGVALLAVAVLGRALPGLDRRLLWPGVLVALPVFGLLMLVLGSTDYMETPWWEPVVTRAVLVLPFAALVLVVVAANAAFAAGPRLRRAGAGMLAMAILALAAISGAFSLDLTHSAPTYTSIAIRVEEPAAPGGQLSEQQRRAIEQYLSNERRDATAYADLSGASWTLSYQDGVAGRNPVLPTLAAVLILAGLAALTTALFPAEAPEL